MGLSHALRTGGHGTAKLGTSALDQPTITRQKRRNQAMTERLVDNLDANRNVMHTYPVTLSDGSDANFITKGLEAAASGRLVPDAELSKLTARIHHCHGGRMAPDDDQLPGDSQTKAGLEQDVREKAYLLWEQEGRFEGRSEEYWCRALDQHLRERAYVLWQQQGSPNGRADENLQQVRDFEAH